MFLFRSKAVCRILIALSVGIATGGSSRAVQYKVIYSFGAGETGHFPSSGVVVARNGLLYGTAGGGSSNAGVVYGIRAASGVETVIHNFAGGATDGSVPQTDLILDAQGYILGSTRFGGTGNAGVLYRMSPSGAERIIYSFPGGNGGSAPEGRLFLDSNGSIYGTTSGGGTKALGTIFKVTSAGSGSVLHSFRSSPDGAYPNQSPITPDANGNLIGTTALGGNGQGTIFKVDATGRLVIRYRFGTNARDGFNPNNGVIFDANGDAFGTTSGGLGSAGTGAGTVFKLTRGAQESLVYAFAGGADGASPSSGLVADSAGNLYGTTGSGGDAACGCGTVFKVTQDGVHTVLHKFTRTATDGGSPIGDLSFDASGRLYGVTYYGGASDAGTVYRLTP